MDAAAKSWSNVLRSDLGKLSRPASIHSKHEEVALKEGERRNVTILFLDIQGFTAMSEKLDPEDVQVIIDHSFKILTNEIEKYEGYIDKYEGDRMMALFGVRQATEQDCERAVRAALGMKEKFLEVNQILAERNIKIGIRIGVNCGLVVTGRIGKGRDQDFTVMGDAVNLASRLESNAPPNEIMISEEVRRATGDLFLYEDLGEITVKGKSDPISVYRVVSSNAQKSERWERSPFTKRSKFVGRDRELLRIQECFEEFERGTQSEAVFFSAAPGLGKSRLVHEFLKKIADKKPSVCQVFRASATASHPSAYGVLVELLSKVQLFTEQNEVSDEYERFGSVYRYLLGQQEPSESLRSMDPDSLRLQIHLMTRFVLSRLPGAIVHLDDLQWIDQASLEAFQFVLQNTNDKQAKIFFVLTSRTEFKIQSLVPDGLKLTSLQLQPLGDQACEDILSHALGNIRLSKKDQSLLTRKADGNPFFMEELLQSLIDDGTIVKEEQSWKLAKPLSSVILPDTIQSILMSRIDKLEKKNKDILMAAAVIGETVPVQVLEEVAQKLKGDREGTENSLRLLVELGFLFHAKEIGPLGEQVAFRHILIRDVVYNMILNHNKKILHELVARSYEKLFGPRAMDHAYLLFHHFANSMQSSEMKKYGLIALEELLKKNAVHEGLKMISELRGQVPANVESEDPKSTRAMLEAEVRFYDFLGRRSEQLKCIEQLETVRHDPPIQHRVCFHRASYCNSVGDFRKAEEYTAQGLEFPEVENDLKMKMELSRCMGVALYGRGQYEKARMYYHQGLKLSVDLKDGLAEAGFYNTLGLIEFNLGNANAALTSYAQAFDIMKRIGNRKGEANALGNQGLAHWSLGEYSLALKNLRESHDIFVEIGFKKGQAVTLGNIGVIHNKLGLYDEALGYYERALVVRREIKDRAGEGYDLVNIATVHMSLENDDKAQSFFNLGIQIAKEVGSNYLLCENLNSLGVLLRRRNNGRQEDLQHAKQLTEQALSLSEEHKLLSAQIRATSNLARIYLELGQKDLAVKLSQNAMSMVERNESAAEGSEEEAYINHYHIMSQTGQMDVAVDYLKKIADLIEERANKIQESKYRQSFLQNVRQHSFVLDEKNKNGM